MAEKSLFDEGDSVTYLFASIAGALAFISDGPVWLSFDMWNGALLSENPMLSTAFSSAQMRALDPGLTGDSFSQFRFAEEKEWDGETSCPKQNSALYVDSESLVRALQQLPLSVRLNVASELIQTTIPLELPQVKPRRNDDGKELGMQLRGPISELRSAAGKDSLRQSPPEGLQKAPFPPQSVADHLEDELDMLLHLDAPMTEEDRICPDQMSQDQEPDRDQQVAQEETVPEKPSMTGEKNVEPEQTSTSKNVTEEDLEDWLDSMIS
ncbi:cell death regulator Aven-like protein [Cricetulus griseus]|nr:cell death regulator Aven-like protein [Cricetulus griseus]